MSAPIAMGLGYHTFAAGFDPIVDLPGLLWLIHTDDSTISAGKVSAINDRVAAYAFAQGTAGNRPIANTADKPGHTVWELAGIGRRFLSRNGAPLAGALNSAPACTFMAFAKLVVNGSTDNDFCGHTDNLTTYANSVRLRTDNLAAWGWREVAAAGATNYADASPTVPTTWGLHVGRSDGAGNLTFLFDGVSVGSASGTHRSPASMTEVVLGEALASADATKSLFIAGLAACTGEVPDADLVKLAAWYAASLA